MNIIYHLDTQQYPHLASFRYRAAIPGDVLKSRSYGVRVMHEGTFREGEPQVHIFLKHFNPMDRKVAKRMRFDKHAVVFDICDDHFHKMAGDYYREMCQTAHVVTCNSEVMRERIKTETGRDAVMIPDPYELPERPAVAPASDPQLLWFGHPVNFDTLPPLLALPFDLDLVTLNALPYALTEDGTKCQRVIPYSLDSLLMALGFADIVVLPTLDTPRKHAKSANRVIESLRAGRAVVAGPDVPSYHEFKDFIWIGDLADGIHHATTHPEDTRERIRAGQDYIRDRYSPATIADQWERVIHQAALGVRGGDDAGLDQCGREGMEAGSGAGSS